MEILSVSLKNFKSHSDRHFPFQPGTNAICGENGAGKTSILEAIAWVLFDHKGDYKVEDLIRNGTASAQATVVFISSHDQRTYKIQRCTRLGYTIFDPQLGEKLAYTRIREEVLPWLRQHLGVASGTDLAKLFSNTIGVPQGTFTADFLQTAERRKPIFDAILKVEEYRQANQQMLTLEKYAKSESESLERTIAHYDEALEEWEIITDKQQTIRQEIAELNAELAQCQQRFNELQAEQAQLSTQAAQMQQLTRELEKLSAQIQSKKLEVDRLTLEFQQAEQSVEICTTHRTSYQTFLQTETTLQELEKNRGTQQSLMQQRQGLVKQESDRQTKFATITQQLERRSQIETEIQRLEPLIQHQIKLDQQQQELNQQLQTCHSWRQTISRDQKRLAQLEARRKQLGQEIEDLEAFGAIVQKIPQLEAQQQRYQQQLSRIDAATQFEADLRQIVTQAQTREGIYSHHLQSATVRLKELQQAAPMWAPHLTEVLATLGSGAKLQGQLMTDLQGILEDLSEQLLADRLKQHLQQVQTQLQTARQQQIQFLNLDTKLDAEEALAAEIEEVRSQILNGQTQLTHEPELKQQLAHLNEQLQDLNDPRGKTRLLQQELQQQTNLEVQQRKLQSALLEIQNAIAQVDTQLADFANLAEQIREQQILRDEHRPSYQLYLEHQQSANSYRGRKQQLEEVIEQTQAHQERSTELVTQQAQLAETFDPVRVAIVQTAYQEARDKQTQLTAQLPEKVKRLEEYEVQISKLQAIQEKRDHAQTEAKRKQKVERFIKFARKAYKDAGPRITERYVQNISREADKLFRELLNRPNVALEWTRDYEIVVQEGAHPRRLINLSGGEQMCAALAVRLALLKVLADINIAFFDEPTTNMDKARRESLAEAIANIKTFRQLFVISHDDTFEKVTENVILVEREL
ncbi:SMC family ATPase [Phormidesmis priestleyi ULC007]|uniref:Nuclease SbcCD subunit C n=1 Tax=Phormidesmis priestleyi ULC007 TaxID=1920490 RepID=A0A2T1DES0_9CYAN|nr:SMC family ATPase [Phormidesmis priestleyi]PSB19010.1 SMC family ATPase [Phormidesmis priestleyi ULC007]PZO53998.1 MAG: SMC family ATPase [Phormidesmis priestleyi]